MCQRIRTVYVCSYDNLLSVQYVCMYVAIYPTYPGQVVGTEAAGCRLVPIATYMHIIRSLVCL